MKESECDKLLYLRKQLLKHPDKERVAPQIAVYEHLLKNHTAELLKKIDELSAAHKIKDQKLARAKAANERHQQAKHNWGRRKRSLLNAILQMRETC